MKIHRAWRIHYDDDFDKAELTQSPSRVNRALELGLRVVELTESNQVTERVQPNQPTE